MWISIFKGNKTLTALLIISNQTLNKKSIEEKIKDDIKFYCTITRMEYTYTCISRLKFLQCSIVFGKCQPSESVYVYPYIPIYKAVNKLQFCQTHPFIISHYENHTYICKNKNTHRYFYAILHSPLSLYYIDTVTHKNVYPSISA